MNFTKGTLISVLMCSSFLLQACADSSGGGGSAASELPTGEVCTASMTQASFFEEVDLASSVPPEAEKGATRYRNVHVDLVSLKQVLKSGQGLVRLDLFKDKILTVKVESIETDKQDNITMSGGLVGDPLSQVSLAIHGNVISANIQPGSGHRYVVNYQSEDVHTIQEVDAMAFDGNEECEAVESPVVEGDQAMDLDEGQATTPVIDMLVAYTAGARSRIGGTSAMLARINTGIADTNRAYANSGVNLKVRLVGTMEVSQSDTNNFSSDLSRLKGTSDGRWDSVHARRRSLGADQVTLIGVYSGNGTAGIGYIKASYSTAFSIVKYTTFGSYTFSHELGHNIGLNHSDGYVNSSGRFRTIMAYGSYPRVARFSNPSKTYNGYRTGSTYKNSSKILNLRGGTASRFTAQVVSTSQVAIPVTPAGDEAGGVCE